MINNKKEKIAIVHDNRIDVVVISIAEYERLRRTEIEYEAMQWEEAAKAAVKEGYPNDDPI